MAEIETLQMLTLVAAGLIAGVVNTLAGGGSLLTLPALLWVGLPPHVANGTNRLSILLQSSSATWSMHRSDALDIRLALRFALPSVSGAMLGVWAASTISAKAFLWALVCVLILGAIMLVANPKRWLGERPKQSGPKVHLALFLVGMFGGFVQAGVGMLFLLAIAGVAGESLVRANAAKNMLVALYTAPALVIFALQGYVAWGHGLALAVGSVAGAQIGVKLSLKGGNKLILVAVVIGIAVACVGLVAKLLEM